MEPPPNDRRLFLHVEDSKFPVARCLEVSSNCYLRRIRMPSKEKGSHVLVMSTLQLRSADCTQKTPPTQGAAKAAHARGYTASCEEVRLAQHSLPGKSAGSAWQNGCDSCK